MRWVRHRGGWALGRITTRGLRAAGPTGHQTRSRSLTKPLHAPALLPCAPPASPGLHDPCELRNPGLTSFPATPVPWVSWVNVSSTFGLEKALKGFSSLTPAGGSQSIPPSPSYPPPTEDCHTWDSSHAVSPLTLHIL